MNCLWFLYFLEVPSSSGHNFFLRGLGQILSEKFYFSDNICKFPSGFPWCWDTAVSQISESAGGVTNLHRKPLRYHIAQYSARLLVDF
jgi:hypothetical protein